MGLDNYRKKRKFETTPEPRGAEQNLSGPLTFVIQKHEASRLHYDFRLELNGVLKSWAVPKGPSLNPKDKRLAVHVEDHPVDYAQFEGIIPKGNYGAGTVMVWDRGVYSPIAFVDRKQAEVILTEQFDKGHLTFVLLGEKLRGEFALVKSSKADEKSWLLFKANDEYATDKDVLKKNLSVLTGRSIEEIEKQASKKNEVWISKPKALHLSHIPKGKMPENVKLMFAQSIEEPFVNKEWLFEIKYDGYRAVAKINSGNVNLHSRNGIVFDEKFAEVTDSLKKFPANAVFDGEIVVVDSSGRPHFQWLQDYPDGKKGKLIYYVFDLLYYDGHDVSFLPLYQRKELLKKILPNLPHISYADHIEGEGVEMFRQVQKMGIEGIIAKQKQSIYKPGERTSDWLKIKTHHRQEVVIAGFTEPNGSRKYFGALIAGVYEKGTLIYVGHIGGGFDDVQLKSIYKKLRLLIQHDCPFSEVPKTNAPVTWVKPELLAEVFFSNWTNEHQMRHPVFLGLREDKDAKDVQKETFFTKESPAEETKALIIGKQKIELTNLTKVFWPQEKFTKGNLIDYYKEIALVILPYLKNRPESLHRYPNGIAGGDFYQKDAKLLHEDWLETITVHSESANKQVSYVLCQNEAMLLYLINLGCIDLNPWSSRVGRLDNPDYLIIDLDPEQTSFGSVIKTALAVRGVLEQLEIPSFCKTSGATGMHVYIPLGALYTYEQSRRFAELLCIRVHAMIPDVTSLQRDPKKRSGLVYLDYLQNIRGQTLASVYSVRAQPGATVSTPLLWSEVTVKLHPSQFTMKNVPARIQKYGDLFKEVLGKGIDMEKVLKNMEG